MNEHVPDNQDADRSATSRHAILTKVGVILVWTVQAVPIVLALAVAVWVAPLVRLVCVHRWHLPLWLAVTVSVLGGIAAAFVFMAVISIDASTLLESGMRCVIIIALALLVLPFFTHLRAKHRAHRPGSAATSGTPSRAP